MNDIKLSIILLDWGVRERFFSLDWLNRQDIPREQYELIWVELYDREVPEVAPQVDRVIHCRQKGIYHKHVGYNEGLLAARGQIVCVCDSDVVFPPNFVRSILEGFELDRQPEGKPLVLFHYEYRGFDEYPDEGHPSMEEVPSRFCWDVLWENVGACMSVRREDAIRFGGFDEHSSYRGYMCGPYELGWRLVNAGIPEVWHDPSVALWHFAHPNPVGAHHEKISWGLLREVAYPHVDGHAFYCVEAFRSGRLLPLRERKEIFLERMAARRIGSRLERAYAEPISKRPFHPLEVSWKKGILFLEIMVKLLESRRWIPRRLRRKVEDVIRSPRRYYLRPLKLGTADGYDITAYLDRFYGIPLALGDFNLEKWPSEKLDPLRLKAMNFSGAVRELKLKERPAARVKGFSNRMLMALPMAKWFFLRTQLRPACLLALGNFEFYLFKNRYYMLHKSRARESLLDASFRRREDIFRGKTLQQTLALGQFFLIDLPAGEAFLPLPFCLGRLHGYAFWTGDKKFHAFPMDWPESSFEDLMQRSMGTSERPLTADALSQLVNEVMGCPEPAPA